MSQKRNQNLKKNLIFTAAVLLAAAALGGYYLVRQADRPDKVAHLVYGTLERAQTDIDLREDADYSFQSNGYEIHLQVREGHRLCGQPLPRPRLRAVRPAERSLRLGRLHPGPGHADHRAGGVNRKRLSKKSRPDDMCVRSGHIQGNLALRVCEPPCGECAVQRQILSPGGYQGEGISVPRMRAEMGPPWSVSFFDTLNRTAGPGPAVRFCGPGRLPFAILACT